MPHLSKYTYHTLIYLFSSDESILNNLEKAQILLAQHSTSLAIQFLSRALESEPENLEGLELAGVAECEEGDVEKGREVSV